MRTPPISALSARAGLRQAPRAELVYRSLTLAAMLLLLATL